MLYGRVKRIKDKTGYVAEFLIGRLGISAYAAIEQREYVAPRWVLEVSGWIIKR